MDLSLHVVPKLISLPLILLPQVLLIKPLLILNMAIHGIIQPSLFFPSLRKLFNPSVSVRLRFFTSLFLELVFLIWIVELTNDVIEVMRLPILLSSVQPLNLSVNVNLLVVQLEVSVRDDVVVSKPSGCNLLCFNCIWVFHWLRWPFVRRQVVVLLERLV